MKDRTLPSPDLDPAPVFDPTTVVMLVAASVFLAVMVQARFGTILAIISFFVSFYYLYKLVRYVQNYFPPGYIADKLAWIGMRDIYFPGKAKKYPPLIKQEQ